MEMRNYPFTLKMRKQRAIVEGCEYVQDLLLSSRLSPEPMISKIHDEKSAVLSLVPRGHGKVLYLGRATF